MKKMQFFIVSVEYYYVVITQHQSAVPGWNQDGNYALKSLTVRNVLIGKTIPPNVSESIVQTKVNAC